MYYYYRNGVDKMSNPGSSRSCVSSNAHSRLGVCSFLRSHLPTLISCLLFLTLVIAAVVVSRRTSESNSPAQRSIVKIQINVNTAALPATIGVPISEKASVFDAAELGVTDANGVQLPAQMRVLSRW